jgi:hypothetical protein
MGIKSYIANLSDHHIGKQYGDICPLVWTPFTFDKVDWDEIYFSSKA